MAQAVAFLAGNFTLTFLILGLALSLAAILQTPRPWTGPVVMGALFKWFLFCSIGASFLYNAVMHTLFAELAASFIGWANSPFQYEVGFASLGFAAVGFFATWGSLPLRFAAILGPALFLWGAAGGHVVQMVTSHNFAPGNAGIIFWTDLLLPVLGFVFLWYQWRTEKHGAAR